MSEEMIDVSMGSLKVADSPAVLTTGGIGSCIAICLFHSVSRKGALAHIMLPARQNPAAQITQDDLRYADAAVEVMLAQFASSGIAATSLICKLVGGASMFPEMSGRSIRVGERNVESVHALLQARGVRVVAEDVGGSVGRAVYFDLGSGVVQVRTSL